ncbi:MAG: 23S rRNA (adenine(2503)-C(2))-methyltransferase RlmN [Chlamydiae bacterium]|nr:23S rRNA (adenine(2503)-C(2))-methyltransferase RlmN [Chlamydiota bacterium]
MEKKRYFLDLNLTDWEQWAESFGFASFRGKQIFNFIFKQLAISIEEMSNLPKEVKGCLEKTIDFFLPSIDTALKSIDQSVKFLLKTHDNFFIESVLMPSENRTTLCISSQVGCKMGCTFCQTGKMGLARHLSSGEILSQLILAGRYVKEHGIEKPVSNIVFMGMGEPLDNYDHVVKALKIMTAKEGFELSKNKVTVSTCGLIPEIRKLAKDIDVSLAISLHTADEDERSNMMPINKKYSLKDLKEALLEYPQNTRHGITFEYVMINDQNDSISHAKKLVKFLHGIKAKVNLIPMNPHPGSNMHATDPQKLKEFQQYLSIRSIPAPIRYSRGQDVSAACGQLVAKRQEELLMLPKDVARLRRLERRNEDV